MPDVHPLRGVEGREDSEKGCRVAQRRCRHWDGQDGSLSTGSPAFAGVMVVQDHRVETPDAELETLNGGADAGDIVGLAHSAEDQSEDRVLRVDGDKTVIATRLRKP